MKCYKAMFMFDNGIKYSFHTKYVFATSQENATKYIKEYVNKRAERMCIPGIILNLTVIKQPIHEGMIMSE